MNSAGAPQARIRWNELLGRIDFEISVRSEFVGSWLKSSRLLKSEAKYPSATERPSNTKGMVLEPRERGCLTEVKRHPGNGKAESLFGVTAHHELTPNAGNERTPLVGGPID